jgi:hypothetical protein
MRGVVVAVAMLAAVQSAEARTWMCRPAMSQAHVTVFYDGRHKDTGPGCDRRKQGRESATICVGPIRECDASMMRKRRDSCLPAAVEPFGATKSRRPLGLTTVKSPPVPSLLAVVPVIKSAFSPKKTMSDGPN